MKEEANNPADSGLNEIMAARIEIAELNDAARQTQINDAIKALEGVIEFKIENGALHVSYDPMTTTEKKIEATVRSIGASIKAAATDTEAPHPDLPTQAAVRDTRVKGPPKDEQS